VALMAQVFGENALARRAASTMIQVSAKRFRHNCGLSRQIRRVPCVQPNFDARQYFRKLSISFADAN
jgi:hypothetical protein